MIDLTGLNKAEVLAALYNASRPQGMGFLQYDPTPMATEEANQLLQGRTRFDYLKGRVMKIDLGGEELDPRLYNRDNGEGAAERVISALKSQDNETIKLAHEAGVREASKEAEKMCGIETEIGERYVSLGMKDVAAPVRSAIEKAKSVIES